MVFSAGVRRPENRSVVRVVWRRSIQKANPINSPKGNRVVALRYYRIVVPDEILVICPYCGEQVEIYVEPDVRGSFIQDCEVCCNPWRVRVSGHADTRSIQVTRADGSE